MSTTLRRALPFLAPLCLAFVPLADELRYDPKPGSEVTRALDIGLELSVDEVSVEVNGQPIPSEAMGEVDGMSLSLELALAVTEKLVGVKGGRPTELLRTYDKMNFKAEAADESTDKAVDALEGKTVRFLWDEEKSEYARTWHESTGEDAVLASLSPDLDMRVLLPGKKLEKGDKWELTGTQVLALLAPGMQSGNLDLGSSAMGEQQSKAAQIVMDELGTQMEEAAKGLKLICEYTGSHEDEGATVADVHLHLDGDLKLDLGPVIDRLASELESGAPDADVKATLRMGLKGEGTLLWDVKTNQLHHYELESDVTLGGDIDVSANEGGQAMHFRSTFGVSGKGSWKLAAKKP